MCVYAPACSHVSWAVCVCVCVFKFVCVCQSPVGLFVHLINNDNDELQIDYPGVKALVLNLLWKAATCELCVRTGGRTPIAPDFTYN